jgi:hypothetical protein
MTDPIDLAQLGAGLTVTALGLVVMIWVLIAIGATIVAPRGRRLTFFLITILCLGPLGLAAASVAQPRTSTPPDQLPPPEPIRDPPVQATQRPRRVATEAPAEPAGVQPPILASWQWAANDPMATVVEKAANDPMATMVEVEVVAANDPLFGKHGILEKYTSAGLALVRFPGSRNFVQFDPDYLARVIDD